MNPILAYAIEHQAKACRLLAGFYGVPIDDVADASQEVFIKIMRANPSTVENIQGYWSVTIRSVAYTYHRRRLHSPNPLETDKSDPAQDPQAIACQRETIREIWAAALPHERRGIIAKLTQRHGPLSDTTKAGVSRLKRRLRERAAA